MTENSQLLVATAKRMFKGFADETMRKRIWLAMAEQRGNIEFNAPGPAYYWDVMYSEPGMRQYGDGGDLEFTNHEAYKQLNTDIRGYELTDKITEKQRLLNQGELQIVDLMGQKVENLKNSARRKFGRELYVDGNASGNENRFHGIESFMGAGSCAAGDRVAKCSDTYSGLSTIQGNYGGSWSTDLASGDRPNATLANDWPNGSGSAEYDFFSPKLINYSSTAWPSGLTTWRDNCFDVLTNMSVWCRNTNGDDGAPMLCLMGSNLFTQFKEALNAKSRIILPHAASQDLGFEDALDYEGMSIKWESDCPANVAYGLLMDQFELSFATSKMFANRGPEYDIKSNAYLMLLYTFGNIRWRPKHFAKIAAVA